MFLSVVWRAMDWSAGNGADQLFLAILPVADAAAQIYRLACALNRAHQFDGNIIEPERLHVSLFSLGGERDLRAACEAAAEVRMPPFEVLFDRSASFQGKPGNRPLVLVGDDGLERLRTFRRTLGVAMAWKGLGYLTKKDFTPHVTMLYAERDVEEYPVEPIRWTVNEFVLIHSLHGHVHLARWPLRS